MRKLKSEELYQLLEYTSTGVKWNYNIRGGTGIANRKIKPKSYYCFVRDACRQLKYVLEKRGDRVEALKFQAKEMEAHWRALMI